MPSKDIPLKAGVWTPLRVAVPYNAITIQQMSGEVEFQDPDANVTGRIVDKCELYYDNVQNRGVMQFRSPIDQTITVFYANKAKLKYSAASPVTVTIPQPLTVRGEQPTGTAWNGGEYPFLGGMLNLTNFTVVPLVSFDGTALNAAAPDVFSISTIGLGAGNGIAVNYFNRKTFIFEVRNLKAGEALKVMMSMNGSVLPFTKVTTITNLFTGAAVTSGTIIADGTYQCSLVGIRSVFITSNGNALTQSPTVGTNGSTM